MWIKTMVDGMEGISNIESGTVCYVTNYYGNVWKVLLVNIGSGTDDRDELYRCDTEEEALEYLDWLADLVNAREYKG